MNDQTIELWITNFMKGTIVLFVIFVFYMSVLFGYYVQNNGIEALSPEPQKTEQSIIA